MIDRERLVRLFSGPELEPLLMRMRRRLERGMPLSGTIVLTELGSSQIEAIGALLGRSPAVIGDRCVSVPLDDLAQQLAEAGICRSLRAAVEQLTGPVENTAAARDERDAAWSHVFDTAPEALRRPPFAVWLDGLKASGGLKRLARSSPVAAKSLLARVVQVTSGLPAAGEPIASFAATRLGNAHGLDPGTPVATLALRAAARLGGIEFDKEDAETRRAVWASVGVMCDELSTPALVLNLPAAGDTPLGRMLRTATGEAEPLHVSLRLLLRWPLAGDAALGDREVFVCENPTVVALATARLGRRCAPLICANGQFATPLLVLLRQLRDAGARVRYHGDFDPAGLAIARRVMAESGAQPWRFGAAEYIAAPKGEPFVVHPGPTPWDARLREAMRADGRAVHEEAVFATLAEDLARGAGPPP